MGGLSLFFKYNGHCAYPRTLISRGSRLDGVRRKKYYYRQDVSIYLIIIMWSLTGVSPPLFHFFGPFESRCVYFRIYWPLRGSRPIFPGC